MKITNQKLMPTGDIRVGDNGETSHSKGRKAYVRDPVPDCPDVTMIRAADGGPLRTFSGGLAHENGWFASSKARRLLHWQGTAQLEFIMRAEVEFGVRRMATESVRFEFVNGAGKQSYTADVELIAPDGSVTLVEIKRDQRDLKDADYVAKLRAVGEICHSRGITFKVVFRDEIWSSIVHRRNVTLFASRAFVTIESEHLQRLDRHVTRATRFTTYGELSAALEPASPRTGEAIVQALTVARRFEIDLTRPLFDGTPVTVH